MTSEDFYNEMKAIYPQLYNKVYCGFDCPIGWQDIIRELSEQLKKFPITCVQVKEKFGGLRWYWDPHDDDLVDLSNESFNAIDTMIKQAEEKSYVTCMTCGKPGQQYGEGAFKRQQIANFLMNIMIEVELDGN